LIRHLLYLLKFPPVKEGIFVGVLWWLIHLNILALNNNNVVTFFEGFIKCLVLIIETIKIDKLTILVVNSNLH